MNTQNRLTLPFFLLLAACTSPGPAAPTQDPAGPTTGSLRITVTGPANGSAAIVVSGSEYSHAVAATTTLSNLVPGTYLISASNIVVSGLTYEPTPLSVAVNVAASATPAEAAIAYVRAVPVPAASLVITPATAELLFYPFGSEPTLQLAATIRDEAGNILAGRLLSWSSDDVAVATVDRSGLIRVAGPGRANVTAHSEALSATAAITVIPAGVKPTVAGTWQFTMSGTDVVNGGQCTGGGQLHLADSLSSGSLLGTVSQSGRCWRNFGNRSYSLTLTASGTAQVAPATGSIGFSAGPCRYSGVVLDNSADSMGGTGFCKVPMPWPGKVTVRWSASKTTGPAMAPPASDRTANLTHSGQEAQ